MIKSGVLNVSDSVYVLRMNEVGCYLDSQHRERLEIYNPVSTILDRFAVNQIQQTV